MARNLDSFTARGVRIVAISRDTREDSQTFAKRYGIAFPLLADDTGEVSRAYTGITSDDSSRPGVIIVRDGRVLYRQLADSKDDRLTAEQVLAAVDASLGTHGPALADAHYAAIDRLQFRFDAGGPTLYAHETFLMPATHYGLIGARTTAPFTVGAIVLGRIPFWHDSAALELGPTASYDPDKRENIFGGAANLWFSYGPTWSFQLGGEWDTRGGTATVGIGRLFEF